ncbi:MAG: MFS transporter [Candidatus Omnitrophica bacterium]|nr:MFS transporter [Candidatus Omnitrophota bacterium]
MTPHTAKGRSSLVVIFITVFIDLVGFGIVIPVLPLYAERFGASALTIGLLLGVYSAMQFLFAPLLGKLSDRIGRRPVLLVSIIGTSLGFLLMGCAHTLWLLFVARIIDGITGGNISTAQAYIADVTPPEQRSRGMGLIGAAFGLGFIFGPAIGGLLSHFSLSAPFLFAAGLAACNATALYFFLPESLTAEHRREAHRDTSITEVFREAKGSSLPVVLATYFFTTVAFSLLTATYALFTEKRFGLSPTHIGYIFAGQGVVGAIIQGGFMGWLVRIFKDKTLTLMGTVVLAAGLFLLPMSATLATLLIATAGIAIGHSLTAAPLNGLASKDVHASSQGRVLGLMQASASLARMVGPVLGGALLHYDALSLTASFGRTPYWVGGGIMMIAVLCAAAL